MRLYFVLRYIILYQWQLRYNELCDENEITIVIKYNIFYTDCCIVSMYAFILNLVNLLVIFAEL